MRVCPCRQLALMWLACVAVGCGKRIEPAQFSPPAGTRAPAFELAGIELVDTSRPEGRRPYVAPVIEFIEPAEKVDLKAAGPLVCRFRLITPEGGRLPTFIQVGFKDRLGEHNIIIPEPDRVERAGRYLFRAPLTVPSKPGTYLLRVDADAVRSEFSSAAPERGDDVETIRTSASIRVRVR